MNDRESGAGITHVAPERAAPAPTGRGWMAFAGVMLLVGAAFNTVYGCAAIFNDDYLREESLLYGSVTLWGWLAIAFAVVQLAVALALFGGSRVGALLGIVIAGLNAVVHVMSIGAHPLWSVIVICVDGLIIYGLTVHGFGHEPR
jgi:hypothetical protein